MEELFEYTAATLARALDDTGGVVVGSTGFLFGAEVHLGVDEMDLNQNNVVADFDAIEADFTGYAPTPLVWTAPSIADDNTVEVVSAPITFRPTDAAVPNTVSLLWITDGAGTILFFACQLSGAPLPLNDALDQLTLIVRYRPAAKSYVVVVS